MVIIEEEIHTTFFLQFLWPLYLMIQQRKFIVQNILIAKILFFFGKVL